MASVESSSEAPKPDAPKPEASMMFVPFSSAVELPFYTHFFSLKLEHDKLNDSARPIQGLYELRPGTAPADSVQMQILGGALSSSQDLPKNGFRAEGYIRNMNTMDDFKNCDRTSMIEGSARQIWDAIKDGTIYSVPSLLSSFVILSYADLKRYRMTYWFGFPAMHSDPLWKRVGEIGRLTADESTALTDELGTWRYRVDSREYGFFLAKKVREQSEAYHPMQQPQAEGQREGKPDKEDGNQDDDETHKEGESQNEGDSQHDSFKNATWVSCGTSEEGIGYAWKIASLRAFDTGFFDDVAEEDRFIGFMDPSTYEDHPAWPIRNLLVLIRQRFHLNKVQILCYRDTQAQRHEARSFILPLAMSPVDNIELNEMPKVTGWERTIDNKLRPRSVNLSDSMDPVRLADQAIDLNLKLMKWRIAPELDLEAIKSCRCLLLGAGTLGSYTARILLGWGVRNVTFVDYGNVSFSNPVRQPLFNHNDCLNGGKPKAHRAAEALNEIFPGVEAIGYVLSVPMLGHPVTEKTEHDFKTLEVLIEAHDAIFMLMDSRESRWLPTVMGKAMGKIVLNGALGFDSYVALRHGLEQENGSDQLGCYFCNDVVAPGDSQKDLTLDQQCTVTRPGLAAIASATLVEMLVSILQHPLRAHAPAPVQGQNGSGYERDPPNHPLGLVPHQIRGFLASFSNMIIRGEAYPCCSACSDPILSAYRSDGWNFLKRALEDKDYVSELSGLTEVQRQAEAAENELDWDDEDELEAEDDEAVLL